MLICDSCQKKRDMQILSWFKSLGLCGCCAKVGQCIDIHHSQIPVLPAKKSKVKKKS